MRQRNLLKFDLFKLKNLSNNNPSKILLTLENHYKRSNSDIVGSNFILNPDKFFSDRSTDILYKAQYIELAGRRSYQHYKDLGYKHLDLSYYPDLNITAIKYNPIITIENNKIYFKHEE
jgi:hypothetical protein